MKLELSERKKGMFTAKAVVLDVSVGDRLKILLNEEDAWNLGLKAIDKVILHCKDKEIGVDIDLTTTLVQRGEIGIFKDVLEKCKISDGELISIGYAPKNFVSVMAIKKKLFKKKLTEQEVESLVKDIAGYRISDTLVTYYTASSFFYTRKKEMFWFARYSAIYGNQLRFSGNTAVKYGIGGVPGNETTLIIAPIISALGILYPKTFTKAITSPAATGECADILMNINFDIAKIKQLVEKTSASLALGENLWLASANDRIISISFPLGTESYSKMVTSIMAKLYAGGINNVVIDLPYGPEAKVKTRKLAWKIKKYFEYLGKNLGINVKVKMSKVKDVIGTGVGAKLQVIDVLDILQQKGSRCKKLESKALDLSAELYNLVKGVGYKKSRKIVEEILKSGKAWEQMKKIIENQGGNIKKIADIKLGKYKKVYYAPWDGKIKKVSFQIIKQLARILGCPVDYDAGIKFYKRLGEKVSRGEKIFEIYSSDEKKINFADKFLIENKIMEIK